MSEQLRRAPLSPIELMQLRLRIIRAISRVHGTPAQDSQALADMLALVATVDSLDERLKAAEQERDAYRGTAQGIQLERDQAQARVAELEAALAFYAAPFRWTEAGACQADHGPYLSVAPDMGEVARAALQQRTVDA